jgi:hypothetical protein
MVTQCRIVDDQCGCHMGGMAIETSIEALWGSLLNLAASILLLFLVLAHGIDLKILRIDESAPGSNKIIKI